ncbi:hypothetical protein MLGJGCBP_00891 [Rhodococcus sp. T7]|nr:hypothetical protein MLGJGCBP_09293 [Rhodococcus sp. T7]KAF0965948.1 hypothetical protein MLGJGCBP_00891 [Rhodococcus sp. T7]
MRCVTEYRNWALGAVREIELAPDRKALRIER